MNNRSKLVGVIVVLLLLLFGWRWWTGRQVKPVEAQEKVATASSPNTVVPSISKPGASTANPGRPSEAAVLARLGKFKAAIDIANNGSLDFYGKIIDQNSQPVTGAKVNGYVMTQVGLERTKETQHLTESDAEGNFEFIGLHGESLGVGPEKEGYQYDEHGNGNWSLGGKTDPSNRVIFKMWKLQGAEPMLHTSIQAGLACDGTPRKFDPLTGRRDAGDLVVTLTRKPVNIDRGKPFDWTLTLGISGGGLIPINDLYPDEAPADGYQSSVAINMPSDTKNWTPSVVQSYYIFDGKNYGRITINIMANYQPPPTHFEIDSYVNPAGSRNLEFDPSKQVR
jgi:hypothetical protein